MQINSLVSMSFALKLFGLTFGGDVGNRAPNKYEPPVSIQLADFVNLVEIISYNYQNIADGGTERQKEVVSIRCTKFEGHKAFVASTSNLNHTPHQDTTSA
jgi:hypothetical protein